MAQERPDPLSLWSLALIVPDPSRANFCRKQFFEQNIFTREKYFENKIFIQLKVSKDSGIRVYETTKGARFRYMRCAYEL